MFCEISTSLVGEVQSHCLIQDKITHDYVCLYCGIVNPDQEVLTPFESTSNVETRKKKSNVSNKRRAYLKETEKELLNLCDMIHVESDSILKDIVKEYYEMETFLEGKRCFRRCEIISLSLYQSLMKSGYRRTLKDICSKSRASLTKIWKLQKFLDNQGIKCQSNVITPKDVIASKIGYLDGVDYKDFKRMKQTVDRIKQHFGDFNVHTIAATVIFEHMSIFHKESKMTKKEVCSLVLCCPLSLSRYQQYLSQQNISLGIEEGQHATISKPPTKSIQWAAVCQEK